MSFLPSGLVGSSSQEEGASLNLSGGRTTGEGVCMCVYVN